MPTLVRYAVTTGAIVGVWESNNEDVLAAQVVADDPGYGYLPGLPDVGATALQEDYVVVDGVIVPKPGP
jgi:hypothetical protein